MVHIKRVELSHFKSFGGTTAVPLLPGFTVISGPNGSGKSNILDALLFCLGLATSKGMRADRLPDLVNHNHSNGRGTAETTVSVTFDLSDFGARGRWSLASPGLKSQGTSDLALAPSNGKVTDSEYLSSAEATNQPQSNLDFSPEWTVTRRLRVGKGGNYTSTYSINGETCTAGELQEALSRLRIYPEGYNVVLQGDVTRIITMNSRERREIIDELAGVAEFDRKITQAKQTLENVREREERCRIIEHELIATKERLAADRVKAEKYQRLKAKIQEHQQQEARLIWKSLQFRQQQLLTQITTGEAEAAELTQSLHTLSTQIEQTTAELSQLNKQVKALGEDEQLELASKLATQKATATQLQQRRQELQARSQQCQLLRDRSREEIQQHQQTLAKLEHQQTHFSQETLPYLADQRQWAKATLEKSRERNSEIAAASDAWIQEQSLLSRQITELQKTLNPNQTEQAQLGERYHQLQKTLTEQTSRLHDINQEKVTKETEQSESHTLIDALKQQIQSLAQQLATSEQERTLQQETQTRLLREQREKQRQLDKLEATKEAQLEAQGTYATKIILQSDLPGVCGLVAQLGQVEPRYQLALEIAAGGRLGHIVVEDDGVAAAGIELLKQKRAGRATFLPLNQIQSPRIAETVALRYAQGYIDLAVNLIDCQPRYRKIFAHVFGNTLVFTSLNEARPYMGKGRIVTLEGDLLESSGAMTGGSRTNRPTLQFGTASAGESAEIEELKARLTDLEQILWRNEQLVAQKSTLIKQVSSDLTALRQQEREKQLRLEQLTQEMSSSTQQQAQLTRQLEHNQQELQQSKERLQVLSATIPEQEAKLQQYRQRLAELEASGGTQSEWHQLNAQIEHQEAVLQEKEQALRHGEEQLKDLAHQSLRLEEKTLDLVKQLESYRQQLTEVQTQEFALEQEKVTLDEQIQATETLLTKLSERLGETKLQRDRVEAILRSFQNQQQQTAWQQQKLQETQQQRQDTLRHLLEEIERHQAEFESLLPLDESDEAISGEESLQLERLQTELRQEQKRLQAMEPVNMLALEEYDRTQARLEELSAKLATLEAERTELLLRVENFTTLRLQAFKTAFDAVNENFQSIFAVLSDGDGYLLLDDPEDPFNGGLNLVAHPKGKPVQRLSAMSGGEKSLTALSFIFSLQRYRPSPFYAFDEVDMFLDGANVERLAKMVRRQAEQAQFIVVSLRRPMIESSERTIGVTQARGAYTQVLGIKL